MGFFNKEIKIGQKWIGENHPTYFIAEIGANFDGNLEKAKRLIDAAKVRVPIVLNFRLSLLLK